MLEWYVVIAVVLVIIAWVLPLAEKMFVIEPFFNNNRRENYYMSAVVVAFLWPIILGVLFFGAVIIAGEVFIRKLIGKKNG